MVVGLTFQSYTLKNESVKSTLKEFGEWQH